MKSDYYVCLTRGQSKDQKHYSKGWCMHVKEILGDVLHHVICGNGLATSGTVIFI